MRAENYYVSLEATFVMLCKAQLWKPFKPKWQQILHFYSIHKFIYSFNVIFTKSQLVLLHSSFPCFMCVILTGYFSWGPFTNDVTQLRGEGFRLSKTGIFVWQRGQENDKFVWFHLWTCRYLNETFIVLIIQSTSENRTFGFGFGMTLFGFRTFGPRCRIFVSKFD